MEATGRYDIATDAVTDCRDLYELVTGARGVPQDKTQRLIVLSLRERRMLGRVRSYIWCDTDSMLANGLTKVVPDDYLIATLLERGCMILDGDAELRWSIRQESFGEQDIAQLRS